MAKAKKMDLESIPQILQKATALINKEIDFLMKEEHLSTDQSRNFIAYIGLLSSLYKDYRAEVTALKKELKDLPKEDLAKIIKAEANG